MPDIRKRIGGFRAYCPECVAEQHRFQGIDDVVRAKTRQFFDGLDLPQEGRVIFQLGQRHVFRIMKGEPFQEVSVWIEADVPWPLIEFDLEGVRCLGDFDLLHMAAVLHIEAKP